MDKESLVKFIFEKAAFNKEHNSNQEGEGAFVSVGWRLAMFQILSFLNIKNEDMPEGIRHEN